ncbi:Threonyl-tRNA synthetase, cytoplasmic, putative [Schistosoma mansoni]|uniref:Threonyl-tRNA synthetase, cytoplasmic, putative n=1 Tax=Schistosoma mansoni TaxID=6183 RepID=UPI0001A64237|nr:Threonyl-tRNA synthetase, cytoplasmic, putative [Schistosoma mansoni]|eukprot:XP_018644255.1 Threonyl-tRNA synthetase, cytoplasmic, putative [Schistosoma mansoni]
MEKASNHQCGLAVALNEKSLPPPPEFIKHREELWNKLKREYDGFVASQPRSPVQITLPDGTIVDGKAWETTPMEVAKNIR